MAQSLVKLTLESNQYEKNLRQAQKSWDDFTKGLGLSVGKFTAVGAAIGAVTGALKVAKDAFSQNEQSLDAWGQTVEMAGSLYNGFLNSINTGDISGFLSRIDTITEAAQAAYNALDDLGTFNAFNQINTQRTRTGMQEAIADYRLGEGSKEEVQKAAEEYKKELIARQKMEQEAYTQSVRKIAAERGVPWGNLEQALSGSYGDYQRLKEIQPSGKRTVYMAAGQWGGTMSYDIPVAVTAEEKMGEALRQLTDDELQHLQALGAQAYKTAEEVTQADRQLARILNGRSGSTGGSGGKTGKVKVADDPVAYAPDSIAAMENEVQTLTKQWKNAAAAVRGDFAAALEEAKLRLDTLTGKNKSIAFDSEEAAKHVMMERSGLQTDLGSFSSYKTIEFKGLKGIENLQILPKLGKDASESWKEASSVINSVGTAMQNIDDPAAKVLGYIAQAIASVAAGAGQAIGARDVTASGWGWIGAAAAITAQMVAIISTIHSATGFANGGMVQGSTYSNDQIPIMANAGEVVLTRAMAGNLASQLSNGGIQNLHLETSVDGRALRIVLNNDSQSHGRGRYVTSTSNIG